MLKKNKNSIEEKIEKKIVIMGQRGVGKTSLLTRLKNYWNTSSIVFLDLDAEIEKEFNKKISRIFSEEGESQFRNYELSTFNKLVATHSSFVISVGGGFPVEKISNDIHTIWLQRNSDDLGRIFLDRPKLDIKKSDIEEFMTRANTRKQGFKTRADEIYLMPEGIKSTATEEQIFNDEIMFKKNTYLTLTPELLAKKKYLQKIKNSGFEYRDDLVDFQYFKIFCENFLPKNLILSFRNEKKIKDSKNYFSELKSLSILSGVSVLVDWPLELGDFTKCIDYCPDIISNHEHLPDETLTEFLERLETKSLEKNKLNIEKKIHLKAAPIINSFDELKILWNWYQEDPENRSILPRSALGIWCWFRQYMFSRQAINFWKVSDGSAADQPSLYQYLVSNTSFSNFAAVLGAPVFHSRSPLEHEMFFQEKNIPFFAITLEKPVLSNTTDFTSDNDFFRSIEFLFSLGLKAAAITSPLKKITYDFLLQKKNKNVADDTNITTYIDESSEKFESINTLFINTIFINTRSFIGPSASLRATNTDIAGFQALVQKASEFHFPLSESTRVAIWGGGGTLPIIKSVLPNAIEYSLRTGNRRDHIRDDPTTRIENPEGSFDVLIWAAGPEALPPKKIKNIRLILDLNYRDDSMAKSFAKTLSAIYISGEVMFIEQARVQQQFWKTFL